MADSDFFPAVSQIGTLETLIGSRALYSNHVLLLCLFSVWINGKHEIMVLACLVGPFHLTLTQINSEMNCIAKNKCPESQKLDMGRTGANATSHVEQQHVYFCIPCL